MASETVNIAFEASIAGLKSELAKMEGVGKKEGAALVRALTRQYKRAEKEAKASATASFTISLSHAASSAAAIAMPSSRASLSRVAANARSS